MKVLKLNLQSMKVVAMESSRIAPTCAKLVLTSEELQMVWVFSG